MIFMENFNFRAANLQDWDDVAKISSDIAVEGLVADYIGNIGKKYLKLGNTYVAEINGKIIGFHNVQDVPDNSIYLSGLRIAKEYRNRGLALRLISDSLSLYVSKGKKAARAFIEIDNIPSLSLFSKAGFQRKEQVFLYFGTVDTTGFTPDYASPETLLDIGHVPSRVFDGMPAVFLRKEECRLAKSNPGKWDGLPSFTIFNSRGCEFEKGESFIISKEKLSLAEHSKLASIPTFETAYLFERELGSI